MGWCAIFRARSGVITSLVIQTSFRARRQPRRRLRALVTSYRIPFRILVILPRAHIVRRLCIEFLSLPYRVIIGTSTRGPPLLNFNIRRHNGANRDVTGRRALPFPTLPPLSLYVSHFISRQVESEDRYPPRSRSNQCQAVISCEIIQIERRSSSRSPRRLARGANHPHLLTLRFQDESRDPRPS